MATKNQWQRLHHKSFVQPIVCPKIFLDSLKPLDNSPNCFISEDVTPVDKIFKAFWELKYHCYFGELTEDLYYSRKNSICLMPHQFSKYRDFSCLNSRNIEIFIQKNHKLLPYGKTRSIKYKLLIKDSFFSTNKTTYIVGYFCCNGGDYGAETGFLDFAEQNIKPPFSLVYSSAYDCYYILYEKQEQLLNGECEILTHWGICADS